MIIYHFKNAIIFDEFKQSHSKMMQSENVHTQLIYNGYLKDMTNELLC